MKKSSATSNSGRKSPSLYSFSGGTGDLFKREKPDYYKEVTRTIFLSDKDHAKILARLERDREDAKKRAGKKKSLPKSRSHARALAK